MNRREFLAALAAAGVVGLPPVAAEAKCGWTKTLRTTNPQKALVVWYGQTGHTRRIARLIGKTWEREGLRVEVKDMRACRPDALPEYDLLAIGAPVYYFDLPANVQTWVQRVPPLGGAATATFNTYGGNGRNTAIRLLRALTARGAAPLGVDAYQNMSAFPLWWSLGHAESALKGSNLPNEATFARVRQFARDALARTRRGQTDFPSMGWEPGELLRLIHSQELTKNRIAVHRIDPERCVKCGLCVANCPVGAIALPPAPIDHGKCIVCFGCLNNCPADAVEMTFMHKKLLGFSSLLKQHGVALSEPAELG